MTDYDCQGHSELIDGCHLCVIEELTARAERAEAAGDKAIDFAVRELEKFGMLFISEEIRKRWQASKRTL